MATVSATPGVTAIPVATDETAPSRASSIDWAAIIAGAVLATAITFILITFGSAIGLGLASPYEGEGASLAYLAIAAGLWLVWVQVSSFIAGGYLAGRMRRRLFQATPHEVEVRDGCHGLMVWALGVLLGAALAASAVSGVARTGAAAVSAATEAVGTGLAAVAKNADPLSYSVDTLFRTDNPQAEQDVAASVAEAGRILTASAARGSISPDDKAYLAQMIATRTGVDQTQAEQRIDQVMASIQSAAAEAKAAADKARHTGVIVAFVTAASLVISAAAAWWAAGLGGRHRDEGSDFSHLTRWR